MIVGGNIPEFAGCVDVKTLRVYAPTSVLFLCGGQIDLENEDFLSLRDAFIYISHLPQLRKHDIILAEELNQLFFSDGTYRDILQFEADIAQIAELVVLFSESFGSAAELGAFSMVPEIAANLLVIIDDGNYQEKSFIKLGPIRSLEGLYGDKTVCVIHRKDIKIPNINNVKTLDIDEFSSRICTAVTLRSEQARKHTTFDAAKDGHIIKLIVGLIQHYGSLTLDEIEVTMYCLGINIDRSRIIDFLLCATFVNWVHEEKRGMKTYFSARDGRVAMTFKLLEGHGPIDRDRWQSDIREYWKVHDTDRFASINAAIRM